MTTKKNISCNDAFIQCIQCIQYGMFEKALKFAYESHFIQLESYCELIEQLINQKYYKIAIILSKGVNIKKTKSYDIKFCPIMDLFHENDNIKLTMKHIVDAVENGQLEKAFEIAIAYGSGLSHLDEYSKLIDKLSDKSMKINFSSETENYEEKLSFKIIVELIIDHSLEETETLYKNFKLERNINN